MSSIGRYRMEDEDKTITELIEELKIFKEERGEWLLNNISECKQVEEELLNLETLFKIVFEHVPESYYISDLKGDFVDANRATERITGYKKEELIGKNFFKLNLFNLTDILKVAKILLKNKIGMTTGPDGFTLNRKDKSKVTVKLFTYPAKIKGKKLILGVLENITEYRKMQKEISIYKEYLEELVNGRTLKLKRANERLQKDIFMHQQDKEAIQKSRQEFASLFNESPEAIAYTDEKGTILKINPRFSELFGYTSEEIEGKNIDEGIIKPADKMKEEIFLTKELLNHRSNINFETIRKKKDGTLFPVYLSVSTLVVDEKERWIRIYVDVSEKKHMEKQLIKLARVDSLTGCYNRRYALELIDRHFKLSQRNKSSILLAFLDIDGFKVINDTFGHDEGDKVLKELAGLLKRTLREVDIICRMGGDEFLLIFPESSLKEVPLIKNRISKNLSQLNETIKRDYNIKFSIGFSEYLPDEPKTIEELIRIADQRMYEEKKKNKEMA